MNYKKSAIVILLVIVISTLSFGFFISQHESVLVNGQAEVLPLQRSVTVYFDRQDVPYIEASSEKDLTIAQGFVTASQRLFQMDMLRRIARGEMAAIFGNSCLANDRLARIVGFQRIAQAEYTLLSNQTKNWLKDYCQGVNSYIAQQKLPLEFNILGYEPKRWQPEDTLAILRYLQYASDECWQLNVLHENIAEKGGTSLAGQLFGNWGSAQSLPEVGSDLQKQKNVLMSSMPKAANLAWGSHAWLISGNISKSRKPLLACDKDTLFSFPNLFFLTSLRAPFLHIAGITIPGVPGIIMGRSDNFCWTMVNLKTRCQELCAETFSGKIANEYTNKDGVFQAKETQEEIISRFAPSRLEKIVITKDGPLLSKEGKLGIALSWYGSDPANGSINSIRLFNRAKDWQDYNKALGEYRGSPQAFLYADTMGNIGQYVAGYSKHSSILIPLKSKDGVDKDFSSAEQERKIEPPQFLLASEGQLYPVSVNDLNLASGGYTWAVLRSKQLLQNLVSGKNKINLSDMITLQSDVKASLSGLVVKTLRDAYIATGNTDKYQFDALKLLSSWDGQLNGNSASASIYESFITYLAKKILEPQIGEKLTIDYLNKWPYWTMLVKNVLSQQSTQLLPPTENDFSIFSLDCFSQSLKELRLFFKTDLLAENLSTLQWHKLHKLDCRTNLAGFIPLRLANIFNPFLPNAIGVGGDQDCLNSCNYKVDNMSPFYICDSVPTARLLFDMADNDKFYHSMSFVQSGHLFSKDRIDNAQLESWRKLEFHPMAFSSNQVRSAAKHVLVLKD